MNNDSSGDFSHFPMTHWSLMGLAAEQLGHEQRRALNELLTQYWPALKAHLVANKGINPNEAEDLVQGFIKKRVLENSLLSVAEPDVASFAACWLKRSITVWRMN